MLRKAARDAERTRDELADKVSQIESFNAIAIDRELRMVELKREINHLAEGLNREPPYKSVAAK